jgi:iron complex transport system substrate-binding protein
LQDRHDEEVTILLQSKLYRLKHVDRLVPDPSAQSSVGSPEDHVLLAVAGGWGKLTIGETEHALRRGKLLYMHPGAEAVLCGHPGYPGLHIVRVVFERFGVVERSGAHRLFRKTGGAFAETGEVCPSFPAHAADLTQRLLQAWTRREGKEAQMAEQLFRELLLEVGERRLQAEGALFQSKIKQALAYIHENYAARISRDDVAGLLELNAEYFSVLFKKETGKGFSEYVSGLRIARAKELLLLSDRGVHDIAQEIGYPDGLYLSRKFKAWTGETPTSFAKRPKRIVALEYVGHLLALGIKPVGIGPSHLTRWERFGGLLADIVRIGEGCNPEEVAALEPDLIIVHNFIDGELLGLLQAIATTVVVPFNSVSPFELYGRFASMLGKEREAERFVADYAERGKAAKQRLGHAVGPEETVAYYEIWDQQIWLMSEANGRGIYNLYRTLRLTPPTYMLRDVLLPGKPLSIGAESLADYAADHMLIGVYDGGYDGGAPCNWWAEELMQSELWRSLPAVRNRRAHIVDLHLFAPSDVLSLYHQLDFQVDTLLTGGRTHEIK